MAELITSVETGTACVAEVKDNVKEKKEALQVTSRKGHGSDEKTAKKAEARCAFSASSDELSASIQSATQKVSDWLKKWHEIVRKSLADSAARFSSALSETPVVVAARADNVQWRSVKERRKSLCCYLV